MTSPVRSRSCAPMPLVALPFALLAACSSGDAPDAGGEVVVAAEEILRIGGAHEEGAAAFGGVGGVLLDESGRIVVADWSNHELRVFAPDGAFRYRVGREGSGPGELRRPCCLATGPDDLLWVRDVGNNRFNAYRLGDTSATHVRTVLVPAEMSSAQGLVEPVVFDDSGRLVIVGRSLGEDGEIRRARATVDQTADTPTPAVLATLGMAEPPNDSIGVFTVEQRLPEGFSRFYLYQPYGPRFVTAHAPGGDWARAVTSVPRVERYDAAGTLLHAVEIAVEPVPLSERERTAADSALELASRRAEPPFGVPDAKPPIAGIAFDALGRLWVERTVADGAPREADVFAPDGTLVGRVRWPGDVRLGNAAYIGPDRIAGVARDSLDVEQVVLLRYSLGDLP